ncbi:hypothetical protein CCUS01_11397 [Colletotrichum cuscutae]|uniref:Uncharacterized protein n=1 Tax=Colletotrichum cuscutae TaxID=1209917 RepID=A0AAI9U3B2_9PEZI|nr:hypothetical protein CCUS01_11397 [Colletotrichum cuscutae]
MSTNVVKVNKESVSFRDGNASGINIGDRFFIYDPSQTSMGLILPDSDPVAEVEVTKAFEFSSVAGLIKGKLPKGNIGSLEKVKPGWLARMSRRAHAATVYVDIQDPKSPILEAIKTASVIEANALAPLSWTYPPKDNSTIPDYVVSVGQNTTFEIQHKDYGLLPHIPSINANGSGPRKLVYLLQHISMYHATMKLKPKAGSVRKVEPKYHLNFQDVSDEISQEGVVSAWEITFTNKDQKVLYVTILDLDSAYGISQTYPEGSAASVAVDIGDHFTYRTGIAVPDLLQDEVDNPEFYMEDVFKVIITDEQASFSHLELPDLENPNDLGSSERKTVSLAPRQAAWYVEEKIIRYPY